MQFRRALRPLTTGYEIASTASGVLALIGFVLLIRAMNAQARSADSFSTGEFYARLVPGWALLAMAILVGLASLTGFVLNRFRGSGAMLAAWSVVAGSYWIAVLATFLTIRGALDPPSIDDRHLYVTLFPRLLLVGASAAMLILLQRLVALHTSWPDPAYRRLVLVTWTGWGLLAASYFAGFSADFFRR